MINRDERIREALEGLRERCAQEAERITARRRTVAALLNNEAVKPCELAAAIRKIDVQQYYEYAAKEIEALREEIGRLLDSREREGDRLDWLLARLPGDVIRDLVGEMSCTSDVAEWRHRIDKAARFNPPNP